MSITKKARYREKRNKIKSSTKAHNKDVASHVQDTEVTVSPQLGKVSFASTEYSGTNNYILLKDATAISADSGSTTLFKHRAYTPQRKRNLQGAVVQIKVRSVDQKPNGYYNLPKAYSLDEESKMLSDILKCIEDLKVQICYSGNVGISKDWQKIGDDLRGAIAKYRTEYR